MKFDIKVFGERLKELRKEKELTTVQVAKATGITQATISRWENGLLNPTAENIYKLATFFNVTAGYLIGMEN